MSLNKKKYIEVKTFLPEPKLKLCPKWCTAHYALTLYTMYSTVYIFNVSMFHFIYMYSVYICVHVCVLGWPGATHSVDICEDLEDWSGANLPNMSDTEEEDTVRLVSVFDLTLLS